VRVLGVKNVADYRSETNAKIAERNAILHAHSEEANYDWKLGASTSCSSHVRQDYKAKQKDKTPEFKFL